MRVAVVLGRGLADSTSGAPRVSGTEGSNEIGAVRRSESSTKKASAPAASSQARSTAGRGRASPQSVPSGRSG